MRGPYADHSVTGHDHTERVAAVRQQRYGGDLVAVVEDRRVSELDTSDGLVA
jgi:hypothetical protein